MKFVPFLLAFSLCAGGAAEPQPAAVRSSEVGREKAAVRVAARVERFAANAMHDEYRDGRLPESFGVVSLVILSPAKFANQVLRVAIPQAHSKTWDGRQGTVEFSMAGADLSNAVKPNSSTQLHEGALEKVTFRP